MDKTIVGNNAGKVWYALKEIGEISIPELALHYPKNVK